MTFPIPPRYNAPMTLSSTSPSASKPSGFYGYQQLAVLGLATLAVGLSVGAQTQGPSLLALGPMVWLSLFGLMMIGLGWLLWHSYKRWVLLGTVACVTFMLGFVFSVWRCNAVNPQSITRWGPVYQAKIEALVANSQPLGVSPNTTSMARTTSHRVTFELLGINGYRVEGVARVWLGCGERLCSYLPWDLE